MKDDSANKQHVMRQKAIPSQTKPTKTENDPHGFRF